MNLFLLFRKKNSLKTSAATPRKRSTRRSYHAVEVVYPSGRSCAAVRRLKGKAFLSAEAPKIVVEGCSQPKECQCRYKHLEDRRRNLRRDTDMGFPPRRMVDERRKTSDRRTS